MMMMRSSCLFVSLLLWCEHGRMVPVIAAFSVSRSPTFGRHFAATTTTTTTTTSLGYRNDPAAKDEEEVADEEEEVISKQQMKAAEKDDKVISSQQPNDSMSSRTAAAGQQQQQQPHAAHRFTIPVLGPFPGHAPLVLGAETTLDPPTPMQWQAVEEALYIHQRGMEAAAASNSNNNAAHHEASIDAAPLVALMDDYTAGSGDLPVKGRYATICAVMGSSTCSVDDDDESLDCSSDNADFMESVQRAGRSAMASERRIRLVAIGRAALQDFFYQVPTSVQQDTMDDEGHLIIAKDSSKMKMMTDEDNEEEGDDDDEEVEQTPNIIMAAFSLLTDGSHRSNTAKNDASVKSRYASPVHAVNEMHTMANKIQYLHEDRKKIVAGLQAAHSRLQLVREQQEQEEDELEDHDGLGSLFVQRLKERQASQEVIDKFLEDFTDTPARAAGDANHERQQQQQQRQGSSSKGPLADKENYGMGYSALSVSTIPNVATVWVDKLTPYYSPARCETEEHYYEVLSFVSVLAMDKFLEGADLAWALKCTNTIERLQYAYDWMWSHVRLLREEAEQVGQELRDCGEECTDLW